MKTLGKPHYVLNQDFYYWKNDKMNKVSKGQEYTWNGCAYSPKNYDEKLNQGHTLGEDFVENGELFDEIKNHKDLSRDFSIIFGIKPEEVPSNSSGNKSDFNALAKEVFSKLWQLSSEQNNKLSKAIKDTVEDGGFKNNVKESTTTEGIKMSKTNKQFLKEQVDELKRRSAMEKSYLSVIGRDSGNNLSEESCVQETKQQARSLTGVISQQDVPKNTKAPTEKEGIKDKYIITFKDGLTINITKNMFDSLYDYSGKSNVNGYNIASSLLFATDKDTGEMICLDSSSILSITKV